MASIVEREDAQLRTAVARVEELESIAEQAPTVADRLRRMARDILAEVPPVRPSVAAAVLELNEKSIRAWTERGILTSIQSSPTRLDPERLHEVMHLVADLRAAGRDRNFAEALWHRLEDDVLLAQADVREGLAQFHRGEGVQL